MDRYTNQLTMTGLEVPYVIPADTRAIQFQANGGDILMTWVSGETKGYTIMDGGSWDDEDINLAGMTVYFTGTGVLEVNGSKGLRA